MLGSAQTGPSVAPLAGGPHRVQEEPNMSDVPPAEPEHEPEEDDDQATEEATEDADDAS